MYQRSARSPFGTSELMSSHSFLTSDSLMKFTTSELMFLQSLLLSDSLMKFRTSELMSSHSLPSSDSLMKLVLLIILVSWNPRRCFRLRARLREHPPTPEVDWIMCSVLREETVALVGKSRHLIVILNTQMQNSQHIVIIALGKESIGALISP